MLQTSRAANIMKHHRALPRIGAGATPRVLAFGFFDGMHRGHQDVIGAAIIKARAMNARSAVLTFRSHPATVLAPNSTPPLLTPGRERLDRIAETGVDELVELPFTRALSRLSPEAFIERLVRHLPGLRHTCIGANWHFGHRAAGNAATLAALGRCHGFQSTAIEPQRHGGRPISSTRIRAALAQGRVADATAMLGRPYSLHGTIVRGRGIGRTLGARTINLIPRNIVPMPFGVYAVSVTIGKRRLPGVANYGLRPTFHPSTARLRPSLEVHILDGRAPGYGDAVDVHFVDFLRKERRFRSAVALAGQIRRDLGRAREILRAFEK